MSKKPEQSDLGMSLKQVVSILQSGRKLTRGAKNQFKNHMSEKQITEKQSQMSFDSKRSIQTKKDNKKWQKTSKKKQIPSKSNQSNLKDFLGTPCLKSYISSDVIEPKTTNEVIKICLAQLHKNHLPNLVRVLLKHHYATQVYEIKKGEIKKQKNLKQQFLIDFHYQSHSGGASRSDVRSITKQSGIVLAGENIVMMKIYLDEFKQIFKDQIEDLKRQKSKESLQKYQRNVQEQNYDRQSKSYEEKGRARGEDKSEFMESSNMIQIQQKKQHSSSQLRQEADTKKRIDEQPSLSFVQIKGENNQQSQQFVQRCEQQYHSQIQEQINAEIKVSQPLSARQTSSKSFTDDQIFQKFCIPGCNYALWPSLIYEPVNSGHEQLMDIVSKKRYFFNQKQQHSLFQTIYRSELGLFSPILSNFSPSSDYNIRQQSASEFSMNSEFSRFLQNFKVKIKEKIDKKKRKSSIEIQQEKYQKDQKDSEIVENDQNRIIQQQNQSQINFIIYPFGSNKLWAIKDQSNLVPWNVFSSEFLTFYLFSSYLKQISHQICLSIQRLNDFAKLQTSQCKSDDIRMSIDRLAKCSIQNRIYNGIPLRYSNIQKKMLVLMFKSKQNTQNQLVWLNIEQISPNFTLPQIGIKNKFLLYFSNCLKKTQFDSVKKVDSQQVIKSEEQLSKILGEGSLKKMNSSEGLIGTSNQKSLSEFMYDIYSTYFNNKFQDCNKTYIQNYRKSLSNFQQQSKERKQLKKSKHTASSGQINRCIQCYYPIYKMQYFKCCFCSIYCHKQCSQKTISKSIELNFIQQSSIQVPQNQLPSQNKQVSQIKSPSQNRLSSVQKQKQKQLWVCDSCQPCMLCLEPLGNKRMSCDKCKNMFHQICGKLKLQENTTHRDKYLCQNCIQCKICQKKLKNLDYVLIKGGYQCVNCYKAQQANEICHICKKQGDGKWAQCSRQFCGKWIHRNCDRYIQSRNFFTNSNQETYFCPFCRKVEKRKIILKIIQILTVFDQYQYFMGSDYEDILDYKYVITNSMCFRKMNERCLQGAYDSDTSSNISKDFQLLISNALKYNMPKDQPHYQARILNILGQYTLQKFRQQLQCTQQQLIQCYLQPKIIQKKRELYRQIYEHYLQIILNYKSTNSIIQVKRPKQSVSTKNIINYNNFDEQFVFSSRYLLNHIFKSSMLKFKIKKKLPKIENLFDIQKVIDAYKSPIKQNFCYYHYWNSNVIFYCNICMQHYCCTKQCYKHNICDVCGTKGCSCDSYQCGCPPLKQKEKKMYQKMIYDKYYDKRQITENYRLCLKCAFQKLSKICIYCQKSYQFYYDFEYCKVCLKRYHKQCADVHASENLSKFFFKRERNSPQQELFSNSLRLPHMCYECSVSRPHKPLMFQKLKKQSIQKLIKLQKLCKYQLLIFSIYHENGIKLSLNDTLNIILGDYEQFLQYEQLFEEYKLNLPSVRLNTRLERRVQERVGQIVNKNSLREIIDGPNSEVNHSNKNINETFKIGDYQLLKINDLNKILSHTSMVELFFLEQCSLKFLSRNTSITAGDISDRNKELIQRKIKQIVNNNYLQQVTVIKEYAMSNSNTKNFTFSNPPCQNLNQSSLPQIIDLSCLTYKTTEMILQQFESQKQKKRLNKIVKQKAKQIIQSSHYQIFSNTNTLAATLPPGRRNLPNLSNNLNRFQSSQSQSKSCSIPSSNKNLQQSTSSKYLLHYPAWLQQSELSLKSFVELEYEEVNKVRKSKQLLQKSSNPTSNEINRLIVSNNQHICLLEFGNNSHKFLMIPISLRNSIIYEQYVPNDYQIEEEQSEYLSNSSQNLSQLPLNDNQGKNLQKNQLQKEEIAMKNQNVEIQSQRQRLHADNNFNPAQIQNTSKFARIVVESGDIEQAMDKMYQQQIQQQETNAQLGSIQQVLMKLHSSHTNLSKISKFKRLTTIHQVISKFLLRCFEFNKSVYRRGNTCILKAEHNNWRVLKKTEQKNQFYEISLKKDHNKWYFSINQNTWWITSIEEIISKLKSIVEISNFRQLADYLGFTFKCIPIEKAVHFTKFLQTNPLDNLSCKNKKAIVLQLYDKFQWNKNGSYIFKSKRNQQASNIPPNPLLNFNMGKQQSKQFVMSRKKIFYLKKRTNTQEQLVQKSAAIPNPPYITYQDLKKDLEDINLLEKQQKVEKIHLNEPGDNVFIAPSPIHKLGLFARQNYPRHTTMVQYIGEIVSESMADVRQSKFHFGCYMFGLNRRNVDKRQIIDATFRGNMARYLNHSCQPNCKARVQVVNNHPRIFIYSIRDIAQYEELTYDYQFSVDANQKLICTCGAKNCQGRLN